MEFLKIILANSEIKEAKLFNAAVKAKANPEIGITINNKAAYHVIKDCADITLRYLPHYVFGHYKNPFKDLKGLFTKKQIGEFVLQAEEDVSLKQLLSLIMECLKREFPDSNNPKKKQKIDYFDQLSDPYGDYGQDTHVPISEHESEQQDILNKLIEAFGAKD